VRATVLKSLQLALAGESAVAAGALPAQSKRRTKLPRAAEFPGRHGLRRGAAEKLFIESRGKAFSYLLLKFTLK
jgi:hypothetical protein